MLYARDCSFEHRKSRIHVAFNSCNSSLKMTLGKVVIYFMRICNTGVLLVSNGKILCDLICACSDDSRTNTYELDTRMNFMTYGVTVLYSTV